MRLLLTDCTPLLDQDLFQDALSFLPPSRQEYALRYRFPKDRNLSVCAFLLLLRLLRDQGLDPDRAAPSFPKRGKPVLSGLPDWHFNLSHSGSLAACLFGRCRCGIDIETISSFENFSAGFILAADELALYTVAPEAQRAALLGRFWTRKEAFLKCLGLGLAEEPKQISMLPFDGNMTREGRNWHFRDYAVPEYALCACLPAEAAFPNAEFLSVSDLIDSLQNRNH